jgi:flavin reductase (DIM6/NTAB) family NADH-FMN oxidoreductase RutF
VPTTACDENTEPLESRFKADERERRTLRNPNLPISRIDFSECDMTSADEFKQAMRHLAGGVAIIATEHEGYRAGLAATAVCSVSADPPTILICINSGASAHEPIRQSARFSVNLLASGQDDIARRFSGETGVKGEERFAVGRWAPLVTGAPVLASALAGLDCQVTEVVTMSTHTVFFGAVVGIVTKAAARPLIYAHGTYGTFSPEGAGLWW